MAYTYQDFVNAANKEGLMNQFSQNDLAITQANPEYGLSILNLKRDAAKATTAEQRALAAEAENQIRSSYGGYTGTYDSQIKDLMGQIGSYGSFEYGNEGQLQDKLNQLNNYGPFNYGKENTYNELLDRVANQKEFSYDLEADPTWSSLRKSYLREGQRASANALEQVAAGSGGIPSSYAVQAAQQAANYYNTQLNDMIPTLQQNAYQKYLNDISTDLSKLSALETDRNFSYQDYLNQHNILQNALSALQNDKASQQTAFTDRLNFLQQQLANYQNQDVTEYNRYLNALNLAYQQDQQKLENAMSLYNLLGYATPEVAAVLGINATSPAGTNGSVGGGDDTGGDSGGTDLSSIFAEYPNGVITDKDYWNSLVAIYGEDVLSQNGIRYQDSPAKNSGVDLSSLQRLGMASLSASDVMDLVNKGVLEETEKDGKISFMAAGEKTGTANKTSKKATSVLDRTHNRT